MKRAFLLCVLIFAGISHAAGQSTTARRLAPTTFSNLGTQANGSVRFCTNCQATSPCTSGGTGAAASRVDGAWNCSKGGGVTVPGSDTQVIYNDSGVLGADAGMVFNETTNTMTLTGNIVVGDGTEALPSLTFSNSTGSGWSHSGVNNVFSVNGIGVLLLNTGVVRLVASHPFGFSTNITAVANDAGIGRAGAGEIEVNDGITLGTLRDLRARTVTTTTVTASGTNLIEGLLSTTAGVDLNTATATTLYTCPASKTCLITKVIARNSSSSDPSGGSWSFGWNSASFNDVIANQTVSLLDDPTYYKILALKSRPEVGATGEVFKVLMNTVTGAAATMTIDVFGYVY